MNTDEQARQRMIDRRNRDHAEAIKRELLKEQNRRAREALELWAERTPERAA